MVKNESRVLMGIRIRGRREEREGIVVRMYNYYVIYDVVRPSINMDMGKLVSSLK